MSTTTTLVAGDRSAAPATDPWQDAWVSARAGETTISHGADGTAQMENQNGLNQSVFYAQIDLTAYGGLIAVGGSHQFSLRYATGASVSPVGSRTTTFYAFASKPFVEDSMTFDSGQPSLPASVASFTVAMPAAGTTAVSTDTLTNAQMQQLLGKWVLVRITSSATARTSGCYTREAGGGSVLSGGSQGALVFTTDPPAGTTARDLFPDNIAQDQTLSGANVVKGFVAAVPAVDNATTVTYTTTTANQVKTVIPFTGNSTAGDTTQNNGWALGNSAGPGLYLASSALAKRVIPAGSWQIQGTVNLNQPALLATVSAYITAKIYRVATGGGSRTLIGSYSSATVSNSSALGAADVLWSITTGSIPQIILEAGESIMIGFTITSQATANVLNQVTNTVVVFIVGSGSQSGLIIRLPAPGIRTLYSRSLADAVVGTDAVGRRTTQFRVCPDVVTGADVAARAAISNRVTADSVTGTDAATRRTTQFRSVADAVVGLDSATRIVSFPRAAADAVAGVDVVARRTTQFRSTVDVVAGVDVATRQTVQFRATADAVTGTDAVTRRTTQARAISDTVTGTDAVTRRTTQFRSTSDSVSGTDVLTRRVTFPRAVADAVTGSDVVTRIAYFFRSIADSVTGTDAVARRTTQFRSTADTVAGTDVVTRRTTQFRATADSVSGTDVVTRQVIAARAVTDAVTGTDVVTRRTTQARLVTDTVLGTDAANRQIIYGRYTYDGRGDYPVRFAGRHISGVAINHETGNPLTETVGIVSLVREFGGPGDPSQDMTVQTTTTNIADGSFSFPRDFFDTTPYHFTVDFTLATVPYHGISDRGLIPELD